MSNGQKKTDTEKKSSVELEIVMAMADFDSLGDGDLAISKMAALASLQGIVNVYRREGVPEDTIILPIIMKKIGFIKDATNQNALREILAPPKIRCVGHKVKAIGDYAIPEEELIIWSRVSPYLDLDSSANQRYMELFREVFPEMAKEFGI